MFYRCLLLVHRYLITIQLPDFLSAIQAFIQLMDLSAIRHIFTLRILDMSGNWMPTVFGYLAFRSPLSPPSPRPILRGWLLYAIGLFFAFYIVKLLPYLWLLYTTFKLCPLSRVECILIVFVCSTLHIVKSLPDVQPSASCRQSWRTDSVAMSWNLRPQPVHHRAGARERIL